MEACWQDWQMETEVCHERAPKMPGDSCFLKGFFFWNHERKRSLLEMQLGTMYGSRPSRKLTNSSGRGVGMVGHNVAQAESQIEATTSRLLLGVKPEALYRGSMK